MPFRPHTFADQSATADNTLAADIADVRRQLNDVTAVTEANPGTPPKDSAASTSLAWDTLRTNLITLVGTQNVGNLARAQDFLDKAPTLRFRGTP